MTTLKTSFNQTPTHLRDKKFLLVLIGLNLFLVTTILFVYAITQKTLKRERLKIFYQSAEQVQQSIEERMLAHINTLRGLQAFWVVNPQVTREEFSLYLDSLNILNDYPGISSVGFVKRDKEKLIITYIEPLEGREETIGFDHTTVPERKAFFDQVRDSGETTSSKPLQLATTRRFGFFLAASLYQSGIIPRSITERQDKLIGFVVLTFRDTDLFKAIFGRQNPLPDIDFAIYHGYHESAPPNENLLFDSDPDFNPAAFPHLSQTKKYVTVGNTSWTIVISAKPSFSLTWAEEKLPTITLIIGLTLSLVLAMINLFFYREHLKTWH